MHIWSPREVSPPASRGGASHVALFRSQPTQNTEAPWDGSLLVAAANEGGPWQLGAHTSDEYVGSPYLF